MNDKQLKALAFAHGISEQTLLDLFGSLKNIGWKPPVENQPSRPSTLVIEGDKAIPLSSSKAEMDLSPFEYICRLGEGGMGKVFRVRDKNLNRTVALKCIRPELVEIDNSIIRFIEESQFTAQLQHPSIIPVHNFGQLDNGLYYFTMPEISGRTLGHLINEFYAPENHSLTNRARYRLLEIFKQACSAVAYAHSNGVIHCDLKPNNIMTGTFGEVYVLDWGVAQKVYNVGFRSKVEVKLPKEHMYSSFTPMMGTPQYMAPEQASGKISDLSLQTDVFSLGLILFQIITGKKTYSGHATEALRRVKRDQREKLEGPLPIPDMLREIYVKATQTDPDNRYADAGELVDAITAWLDGAQKEAKAQELVKEAQTHLPKAQKIQEEALTLADKAQNLLDSINHYDPEEKKWEVWSVEDEVNRLQQNARNEELEYTYLLRYALSHNPEQKDAHLHLSDYYEREHRKAEQNNAQDMMQRMEGMLRFHTQALPENSPRRVRHLNYLRGDGALTITTNVEDCTVEVYRYEIRHRKLEAVFFKNLGTTPIYEHPLPHGSYLVLIKKEGYRTTRYPVKITRLSHWDTIPPNADLPKEIPMLKEEWLSDTDIYIPEGWFLSSFGTNTPHKNIWVPGFVIKKYPVTNQDYMLFLNDLVEQGYEDQAMQHVPKELFNIQRDRGAPVYGRDPDGRFILVPDTEGDLWNPLWPVLLVTWHSACSYAGWYAGGKPSWRLPYELEWEKAARGVDGRLYPWGNMFDESRCCNLHSSKGRQLPSTIYEFPVDKSPYGVRGLMGNCSEWQKDPFHTKPQMLWDTEEDMEPKERICRGNSWINQPSQIRLNRRLSNVSHARLTSLGFRIALPVTAFIRSEDDVSSI